MATTVKTGWLNDNNGDKFAPKTLSSQVITNDGITLEGKIENDLATLEGEINSTLANKSDTSHNHDTIYEAKGSASTVVSTHNTSTTAHNDIRQSISSLQTNIQTQLDNKMLNNNPVGTGSFSMNRLSGSEVGSYSVALGQNCTASGFGSFASGGEMTMNGNVLMSAPVASGSMAHAEGTGTKASGAYSHAEGYGSIVSVSGIYSHAEGNQTNASGTACHAEGFYTTALDYQHAQGHYNNRTNAKAGVNSGTGTGTAFVIGNGTSDASSNAFRVTYDGKPYAKSSFTTSGCDYAEYFEWKDLNPNGEDRRGYFVTLDEDMIKIAEPNDYILGIISGQPSVIGNGDEDWMNRYVFDEFGAFVYEEFEYETEEFDKETGETKTVTKTGTKYKENPDYNPTREYIQREDRPEWDAVGMLGVLSVRDDGTCKVNGYCTVAEGGIATSSETGYRVIKRVTDNIVKVIFR